MPGIKIFRNRCRTELFARGYIFKTSPPTAADHWARDEFAGFHVAHDPRLRRIRRTFGDCHLMCLGTIFDVRYPGETSEACIDRLLRTLSQSEESLLSEMAFTCGRYVLAYKPRGGPAYIIPDATGMKTIFYYQGDPRMVASHHNLLKINAPNEQLRKEIPMKFGYPGLRGPLSNSFLLTPNSKLRMTDFRAERFWPKRAIVQQDLNEASEVVQRNMQGAADHITKRFEPVVSITAGLDSRLTLSFILNRANARFFTYYRNENADTDSMDVRFAREIARDYSIDVAILNLEDSDNINKCLSQVLRYNTYYNHLKKAALAYYKNYGGLNNIVHIRSNISEVGREFWHWKKFDIKNGKDLARLYLNDHKEYTASYVFDVIEHFEEFNELTRLTECASLIDVRSLFYWEFRMASWHAQAIVESDPAFDTLSLFNCRSTLEAMLSVSQKDRRDGMILRNIVQRNSPSLTGYAINGNPFWPIHRTPVDAPDV